MKNDEESESGLIKTYKDVGPYLGLGTQLAAIIILMFFAGRWLDEKFELTPILTIAFSFFGGFAGIYNFIRAVLELDKKSKIEKNN